MPVVRAALLCSLLAALCSPARAQTPAADEPLQLDPLEVSATDDSDDYDATGLGSVEQQLRDEPFANDLIGLGDFSPDQDDLELSGEIAAAAESSPADRIAGEDRLSLRGFPTPVLRNGFIQMGIPETLNTGQTIVIQGPLVPVVGRAAPGGIQNFVTARPRTRAQRRFSTSAGTDNRVRANLEVTGPLQPKRSWQRLALAVGTRTGPEDFAREFSRTLATAVAVRHSRSASTLVSFDYQATTARATPGIPDYRPRGGGKIAGPYLPLATFNANGPDAAVSRRSGTVALLFDSQPTRRIAFRAGLEGWWRTVEQERFTTSVLSLDTGRFEGTREPRHLEQPQEALATHAELTARARSLGAEHKLMLSASQTWGRYRRTERALTAADRDALPASVRFFRPDAPDYFRPAYSPELYRRILTDREEHADYRSIEFSDRLAYRRGRLVLTGGLRHDTVSLDIADRRPGATTPRAADRTTQLSEYLGVNYQILPGRALVFTTASTAFDPSTPVDARTGRIQENETTRGLETGARFRAYAGRLTGSASAFLLLNEHIARRNPLYNDPVADAAQTQPQLVAAGAERFTGARSEVRWQTTPTLTLALKASHTRAVTTASPDLPQEVGRALARLPGFTTSASLRYRSPAPAGGYFGGVSWQYLDGCVANYEDARRSFLSYPGYGLVGAQLGRAWRERGRSFELEAAVRNLLDRDLLASHARLGAGRELTLTARLVF